MKNSFVLLAAVFALTSVRTFAEWKLLRDETGNVVEVVIDFSLQNLRIDAAGTTSFGIKAQLEGEEVGFTISMSKARDGGVAVQSEERLLPVRRVDIDIRSSGNATKNLERRLVNQLGTPGGGNPLRVVGPRSGICPATAGSIADIAFVRVDSVGLTYDESGKQISGDCFGLGLVIDAPLNRITAHFYEPAGYGGSSKKDRARSAWFELHQKKR